MRLLKPTWVQYEGLPMFSIDIHPDGSRFATGGQVPSTSGKGNATGRIVIWNMEPVREEIYEKDPNVPKILCTMETDSACVNCVRWSLDGKYLATAADDKLIIWQASRQKGMSFGSNGGVVTAESWKQAFTLSGHTGDVLHVAWSSHNIWLASCSVDNSIIIWNALKFPERIATLRGHTGMIKGVTFDPVGNYLASQADDKTVMVWSTYDWKLESCIKEPFKECGGTTPVLRLDWSPDGECIVTAHAMNNSGPTAQIIDRDGWKTNLDFVGHRRAITCVRFNPRIMEKVQSDGTKSKDYVVCAVGSKDRSVSIWATCYKRPLVVLHDLFNGNIMDITWSTSGSEMLCCAWDGTVAYFGFPQEEIGTPMSQQDKIAIHKRLYGKTVLAADTAFNKQDNKNVFIESAEFLRDCDEIQHDNGNNNNNKSQDKTSSSQVVENPDFTRSNHSGSASSPMKALNKQIETRTKDGKRKITPIFLAPQHEFGEVPLPYTSFQQQDIPTFYSTQDTSTIVVEKKVETILDNPQDVAGFETPQKKVEEASAAPVNALPVDPQVNGLTQNDRVQPMEVAHSTPVVDPEPMDTKPVATPAVQQENQLRPQISEFVEEMKKKKDGRGRPRKDKLLDTSTRTPSHTNIQLPPSTPTSSAVHLVEEGNNNNNVVGITSSSFTLPPLTKMNSPQVHTIRSPQQGDERSYVLESMTRSPRSDCLPPGIVRCRRSMDVVWETLLPSAILTSRATESVYSAICEGNVLYAYSTSSGRMLFPPIQLRGMPSLFQSRDHYVVVVTSSGLLSMWDFKCLKCLIKNEPMAHLFEGSPGMISRSWITEEGVPLFMLSHGNSYSYSRDMECWILLSSKDDPVAMISDTFTNNKSSYLNKVAIKPKSSLRAMMLQKSDQASRELSTVTHLEKQTICSLALKSSEEYRDWLRLYARHLMHHGMEVKIRSMSQELLTSLYSRKNTNNKSLGFTMGIDNFDLLRDLVGMMKDYPAFQRMYTEFQSQVEDFEAMYEI